uniref:Uncharacterized protein n=1 Tax=Arundo donax TaxID=35708 RepID=A0A0A9A517_ARUDO
MSGGRCSSFSSSPKPWVESQSNPTRWR